LRAEHLLAEATPDLHTARQLWQRIAVLELELQKAETEVTRRENARRERTTSARDASDVAAAADQAAKKKMAEWQALGAWQSLVDDDSDIRKLTAAGARLAHTIERKNDASGDVAAILQAIEKDERDLAERRSALDPMEAALQTAVSDQEAAAAALQAACDEGGDAEATRTRLTTLSEECVRWQSALEQAGGELDRATRLAAGAVEEEKLARADTEAAARLHTAEVMTCARLESVRSELATAEQWLKTARDAARVADLRDNMVEGTPCPVCGSHEHPFADRHDKEFDDLREGEEAAASKVNDLAAAQRDVNAELTKLSIEKTRLEASAKNRLDRIERQQRECDEALRRAATIWNDAGGGGEVTSEALAERQSGIRAEKEGARRALERLAAAEALMKKTRLALDTALNRLQDARRDVDELETALRLQKKRRTSRQEELETLTRDFTAKCNELREAAESIPANLPEELLTSPSSEPLTAWIDEIVRQVGAATSVRHDLERLRQTAAASRSRAEAEDRRLQDAIREHDRALAERTAIRSDLTAHKAETAQFFGGRNPDDVETRLRAEVDTARRKLETARANVAAVEKRLEGLAGEEKACREQHRQIEMEVTACREKAEIELTLLGMSSEDVRKVRLTNDEREAIRVTLERLDGALQRAEAVLAESFRKLQSLELQCPASLRDQIDRAERVLDPDRTGYLETVRDRANAARSQFDKGLCSARDMESATRARLQDDERRRGSIEKERRALMKAEEEARVWETLHGLIGRNDGGAFRLFAQSLNLEKILAGANDHLRRLKPRYRLVQVLEGNAPTLEFEVEDEHHAGARRPLTTLSGGETFLCSLALALGLAAMRRNRLPIETLLLDEGFGTLDRHSLDAALSVLEQLHQDGYRVGLISHVDLLQERISAQIEVRPLGGGVSAVNVRSGVAATT
ncbi:MAG: SbcC/MukB-like Walker B domain-containing protein, partial [Bacteroidota bacterium]